MSFSLFNSGAARAFASGFRPWQPTGGFSEVKSDTFKDVMAAIPAANFEAEVQMAKAGLNNYAGALKTQMIEEGALNRLETEIDAREKANKRQALINMLGRRSGGNGAGANDSEVIKLLGNGLGTDALTQTKNDLSTIRQLQGLAVTPAVQSAAASLDAGGKAIAYQGAYRSGSSDVELPTVEVPTVTPAPAPSTQLSEEEAKRVQAFTLDYFKDILPVKANES